MCAVVGESGQAWQARRSLTRTESPGKSVGQVDDVAWLEQVHQAFQGGAPGLLAEGRGEQDLLLERIFSSR